MRLEVMDIETDDLDAKHIWLICCKNVTTKKIVLFKNLTEDKQEAARFKKYCEGLNLNITGIMCLPPFDEDPEKYFLEIKTFMI